jgi:hypothetical protein
LPESVEPVLENQIIETAEKEKVSPIFEQEQSGNEIAECTPTEKSVSEPLHSKKFVKKKNLFVPIMGVVAVAAAILFFFVPIGKREKQEVKLRNKSLQTK